MDTYHAMVSYYLWHILWAKNHLKNLIKLKKSIEFCSPMDQNFQLIESFIIML